MYIFNTIYQYYEDLFDDAYKFIGKEILCIRNNYYFKSGNYYEVLDVYKKRYDIGRERIVIYDKVSGDRSVYKLEHLLYYFSLKTVKDTRKEKIDSLLSK